MQLYGMETFGQQEGGRLRLIGLKLHSYQVLEISMRMRALLDQGPHLAWVLMVEETKVLMLKSGSISKRSIQDGLFTIIVVISYALLMVFHLNAARINTLDFRINVARGHINHACMIICILNNFFINLEKYKCSINCFIIYTMNI